jgi:sugar lactone lactonase YvrE
MTKAVAGLWGAWWVIVGALGCSGTSRSECGQGTYASNGTCVAVTEVCGEGTRFDGAACVPEQPGAGQGGSPGSPSPGVTCGPGTTLAGRQCLPEEVQGLGGQPSFGGAPPEGVTCGPGTELEGAVCVLSAEPGQGGQGGEGAAPSTNVTCGPGTKLEGEQCVLDGSVVVVTCGEGTVEVNGVCEPEDDATSCGQGTHLENGECVPSASGTTCGDGTKLEGQTCVPTDVKCGPGTHLYEDLCVTQVPQVATTETFDFDIAEKGGEVVFFLDKLGTSVHRYDLAQKKFVTPLSFSNMAAATMAVTPSGNAVYVGSSPGRINRFDTATGASTFFGAAAGRLLWITVTGNYLYSIDDSGAWESHATFSLASGERVFSDDWRNYSRGAAWAPVSKRVFTFRDGTSPNDIYYEEVDQTTGALGTDVESPYHGDYTLGHPIRVSPDESTVFVASGVAFNTSNLTYRTSIGYSYTDLAFGAERLYLLHDSNNDSEVLVLDSTFEVVSSFTLTGKPLRLFVQGDRLTTFTRQGSAIAVSSAPL